jgi:cell division protein FtsA
MLDSLIPRIFSGRSQIIVGLDLGTSHVTVAVGEMNESGTLTIIGGGRAPSHGVQKGEIVDFEKVEEDIRAAMVEAEKVADVEIGSVYLSVTGAHLQCLNNRGLLRIESADHEITQEDVQDVLRNAKAFNKPSENTVLHAIRQLFVVNGQEGIPNPIGRRCSLLELDVHVVHGVTTRLQNPAVAVRELQMDVEELVFSGLASSLAVLTPEQKDMGALVIDMGAGTTEFVVYAGGVVRHTGVIAVGGQHVTNDLSFGLKVSAAKAEELKRRYGSAMYDSSVKGRTVSLDNELGMQKKSVNLEHLHRIMYARIEETFQLIDQQLDQEGLHDQIRAGVVITGGGAKIPEIAQLAHDVFDLDATVSGASTMNGQKGILDEPENATAIGLVSYAAIRQKSQKKRGLFSGKTVATA